MKKFSILIALVLVSNSFLRAAGGPDAYGYTWLTSADPGGPAVQFIDISGYGDLVVGLADDNSAPLMANIGFPFHYYWSDYTQMKIGSNGWASFDNVSNIASCFPNIPTSGGAGDNYLAPLLSDLIFTGVGNIGEAYTYTNNVDTFIIMYKNVPFWTSSAPGYTGSNSFEIILCGGDSSITFQYGNSSPINTGCVNNTVVGIENSTGTIGLEVFTNFAPSNFAIKFFYPQVVLISVPDLTPKWNENVGNQGIFVPTGSFSLTSNVKNVGNVNVSSSTNINADILNLALVSQFTDNYTIDSLQVGDDTTFTYASQPNITTVGEYYFKTTLTNGADINPGNNIINTEIEMIDICSPVITFGYTSASINDGTIDWSGGATDDGFGVHFVPPVYPVIITQMEVYVAANTSDSILVEIYADDGPGGTQGTVLYTGSIPFTSVTTGAWNALSLPSINIGSGGFYIAVLQGGPSIAFGTTTAGPVSRRNYEILSGGWAPYRNNETSDAMLRCTVNNPSSATPAQPATILGATSLCAGASSLYSITPVANATSYTWTIPATWTGTSDADTISVNTDANSGMISVTANNTCGSSVPQTLNITINPLPTVTASATEDTVCSGNQTTLTGGGANSYTWTGGVVNGVAFTPGATATYVVTGTDLNNCSNTSSISIVVIGCSGIDPNSNYTFDVYPNPFTDIIHLNGINEAAQLSLIDVWGQQLESWIITESNISISTTHLKPGIYFLQLTIGNKSGVQKIVKQ